LRADPLRRIGSGRASQRSARPHGRAHRAGARLAVGSGKIPSAAL